MPILDNRYRDGPTTELIAESISSTTIDADGWKFRRLSGGSEIDLAAGDRVKVIERVQQYYHRSAMFSRLTKWVVDFIVGEGWTLSSPDPKADAVLKEFWNSPVNEFPKNIRHYIQELCVYGELAFLTKVRDVDHFVGITLIPGSEVTDVAELPKQPDEVKEIKIRAGNEYPVIRWHPSTPKRDAGYKGKAFFFRINRLGGQIRGYPLLLSLLDWFNVFETLAYNKLERESQHSGVYWDVELEGMTGTEIDEWLKNQRSTPPVVGEVHAHNERVKWELIQARFAGIGAHREIQAFQDFILSNAGLNSFGREKSNIGEILDPVVRGLAVQQAEIKSFFEFMGKFVLQEAQKAGTSKLPKGDYIVKCKAPRLGVRDVQRSSGALVRITESLGNAEDRGYIDNKQGGDLFRDILLKLNFTDEPLIAPEAPETPVVPEIPEIGGK